MKSCLRVVIIRLLSEIRWRARLVVSRWDWTAEFKVEVIRESCLSYWSWKRESLGL